MRFLFKELFGSLKNNLWLYVLIIVSQIIGIVCLMAVYGTYVSYEKKQQQIDIDDKCIQVSFENVSIGEVRKDLYMLLSEIENEIDFVYLLSGFDDKMINCHFEYNNGKYYVSKTVKGNVGISYGRYFITDDIESGENVIVMGGNYKCGSFYDIAGQKFKVIGCTGIQFDERAVWMLFDQCPEKLEANTIIFNYRELPTYESYIKIKNYFENKFMDRAQVQKFEVLDQDEIISIRTMIFMSVTIGMIIALNTGILYGYMIRKRRKDIAVFSIIGASKGTRFKMLFQEIGLVSTATILIGMGIFRMFFEPVVNSIYNNNQSVFRRDSYVILGCTYFACVMIIMAVVVFVMNQMKIKDMLRRCSHD